MSRRLTTSLLLAASIVALGAQPAAAQSSQPGFAIDAVGFESYFKFRARPGGSERGAVRVANVTQAPITVLLHPADVKTATTGGLDYLGERARGDGRWLRLDRRRVELPAGGSATVGFRLRVPSSATPGDHFAGVVAMNAADRRAARRRADADGGGVQLRFLPRLAIAVKTALPGGSSRQLTPGRPSIEVTPSVVNARLPIRHTGHRLVSRTTGELTLLQGTTVLKRHPVALDAIVPGTDVAVGIPFTGTPAKGTYRVVGTLHPEDGKPVTVDQDLTFGDEQATELREETGREAVGGGPSALLVALIAIAAVALVLAVAVLALRQRRLTAELRRRAVR